MAKLNNMRSGCKDVFRAFLVENAQYAGELEIPCIAPESSLPGKLIPFSKAVGGTDYSAWIHFYEDDVVFERLWNDPKRYLSIMSRYQGIITPDFSLYRDMPLVMQNWNLYRGRAIGHWAQENGIPVIANVRWGDDRTYYPCCLGIPHHGTIAFGSHGCMKLARERAYFSRGLDYVVESLEPQTIIVYGTAPDEVFGKHKDAGINILQFDSDYMVSHRKAVSA